MSKNNFGYPKLGKLWDTLMLHDPIFDLYELNISDGVHYITVNLNTKLNFMVKENKIDIFDILVVRKAWGHPKTFYVELVSI